MLLLFVGCPVDAKLRLLQMLLAPETFHVHTYVFLWNEFAFTIRLFLAGQEESLGALPFHEGKKDRLGERVKAKSEKRTYVVENSYPLPLI